ncbi:MAG: O-antigen ligase domain-containing protein [Gammaproteobacteria bacterium]|nr:MAG: O-antigen ligase domain-containing protein [Gammaproteobacteria bacterium]
MRTEPARLAALLRERRGELLILLTLLLLATKAAFNIAYGLITLAGLVLLIRRPRELLADPAVRLLGLLFLCLWLPILASLPDAANPARAWSNALQYPRFFLAGLYVTVLLGDPDRRDFLLKGVLAVTGFWVADALLQYFSGTDLFGYPYDRGQLTGMFYPKMRLGQLLAILAPLVLEGLRRMAAGRPWVWLWLFPYTAVILLSNKRAAWLMYAVALLLWAGHALLRGRLSWRLTAGLAAGAALTVALLLQTSPALRGMTQTAGGLLSGDLQRFDQATSHRVSLWQTALDMARAHWVNGVGPRGYRKVYRDYARPGDFWIAHGASGQTHPHSLLLEIAAETGGIGLAGYLLFLLLLVRAGLRGADPPLVMTAFVAAMPFNVSNAFYGTYWSTLVWLFLPLAIASLPRSRR